ncbi:protein Hook1-like [Scleropages formosus]|uniref:Protein Hook1-like n=1 Tax=Scleropages formosus TaxID=113540 RepID=A0A0P7Z474_SCLFO|nr:protein Hook1-like [Scleropages formosus]
MLGIPRIRLQTFNTPSPCRTVEDLTSGVAVSQALHQMYVPCQSSSLQYAVICEKDPVWFSENWLGRIKDDVTDNWRLKMNNLKKILQMVVDYYNEVLMQQISDFPLPDLALLAERSDPVELGRLLQLILGCALMSKENISHFGADTLVDIEQQLKKALEDLSELAAEKEELAQRCLELDAQVAMLQEERNSLLAENDVLTDRASQLDSFDDPNTPSGKKHWQLQLQLEQLQEENFRLEAAKDDYRIHCEELEKQLVEMQHRNDELTSLAEEARSLKDELDILRSCSDRAVKLEASVETYRKKLEDLGDLRRQVKVLEEKSMTYMQNTVSLEEELRKANASRAQLEMYKRQVQELHRKLSEETRRADNLAFEMKKFEEKLETVIKEKERIIIERDSLKETNEELRCTQAQQDQLLQAGIFRAGDASHDNLAAEMLPIEFREKFIRLQHENKMLRLEREGSENERIAELQALLEEAHRHRSELDTENRLNRERITELQLQVEDLQKALQGQGSKAEDVALKIDELLAALKKKDEDMRAMEDRYKMYLEKARNVIRALDPKLNPATAEIQSLKNQLAEKDKRIFSLERECEQAKLREYEEKLIVTAWYNKSLNFQKMAIESRLAGRSNSTMVPPGQSFLAQQRQVTNARRTLSINTPATSSK